jgi:Holliday junction resolvasome RuvABC endonuclease subunit
MTNLLAIDAGGITGIAVGALGLEQPRFFDLHRAYGDEVARFWRFDASIREIIAEYRPDRIVLEAPLRLKAMHSEAAAHQQLGLRAIVLSRAGHADIPIAEIEPAKVRKALLGFSAGAKRGAIKAHVELWCTRRGLKVPSDNAADAVLLWQYEKMRLTGRLARQLQLGEVAA